MDGDHGNRVAEALNKYATTAPGLLFYRAGTDLALQENPVDFKHFAGALERAP